MAATLNPGDLAIIGVNRDHYDAFGFLILVELSMLSDTRSALWA